MDRTAQCQCGSLHLGSPTLSLLATASTASAELAVFGSGAYYGKTQVRVEGQAALYTREGQEERKVRFHLCPGNRVRGTETLRGTDQPEKRRRSGARDPRRMQPYVSEPVRATAVLLLSQPRGPFPRP
jgi:hypothetical protein